MPENKTSTAQLRAAQKYKKANIKRITVEFSPAESELWEHIQQQPKKQTYIKDLIRADMKKPAGFFYARVATSEQITDK